MNGVVSLPGKIQHWADTRPHALAFRYLANGEQQTSSLTYLQLCTGAQRIAGALGRRGVRPNDRVLLLLPQDLRFITALTGCFFSRVAAVPIKVPRPGRAPDQLLAILKSAAPRIILTTRELFERWQAHVTDGIHDLVWEMLETLESEEVVPQLPPAQPEDLALVQYSSGSTGEPKGIAITHGNLFHNQECIRQAFDHSSDMVAGGWLPMHHDMGLIGLVLQPLYCGGRGVLMSPLAFLQQPLRWLRMISQQGLTTSGGPNFAFDSCVQQARGRDLEDVDLSRWRIAFNGAEPIRSDTIDRFCDTFAAQGFQRRSMYPCYGLAESTLFVSGGLPGTGPITVTAPEAARQSTRYAVRHSAVSCGRVWNGTTLHIVDPDTAQIRPPGQVGEIWVSGPSVGAGYFQDPTRTAEVFTARLDGTPDAQYLRTGDLGFLLDGELIVAGRIKDVVIIRGCNHYPQDLERTMGDSAPEFQKHGGVAFSVDRNGAESLILIQELVRGASVTNSAELAGLIRQNVIDAHGVGASTVMLVTAGVLPRTSSGKLRRSMCRELFLAGMFEQHRVCTPEESVHGWRGRTIVARRMRIKQLIHATALLVAPAVGSLIACVDAALHGVSAHHLEVAAGLYCVTVLGISVGFHRYLSHRAFEAHPALAAVLIIAGSMAAQGPPTYWVSNHRRHHRFADAPGDPHSPYYDGVVQLSGLRGLWHAHYGWTFAHPLTNTAAYSADLLRNRLVSTINRHYYFWVAAGFAIPMLSGYVLERSLRGVLLGFLWGGCVRLMLSCHATNAINSVAHLWGSRPFAARCAGHNNLALAIVAFGEGWHNNHHADPSAALFNRHWWQVDLGGLVIVALHKLGAIKKFRRAVNRNG